MILDTFPSAEEFYKTYWGKKPFIVRGYVAPDLIETLIDGDTLAGLALEDGIKSRIITNSAAGGDWAVEHGPFADNRFDEIGDKNWSLLVQNVEQYHTDTAALLSHFQFSPRWLLDDIMVSFSAPGGSVGPHTDSYHTFLVQGIGKRRWKISRSQVDDTRFADNPDVKVLAHGFEGESFDVTIGDVIYMPPFFGHEGITIEAAMTFSVGFLGPKLSEMMSDYAQYLEENAEKDTRYLASDLGNNSAGFTVGAPQEVIRNSLISALNTDDFAVWMAGYFATPSHEEIEELEEQEVLSDAQILAALEDGDALFRPEHIKLAITAKTDGGYYLSVFGDVLHIPKEQSKLIELLNDGMEINLDDLNSFGDRAEAIAMLAALYNKNSLHLVG